MKKLKNLFLVVLTLFALSSCMESDAENAVEDVGEAMSETVDDAGDAVEDTVDSAEDSIEEASEN